MKVLRLPRPVATARDGRKQRLRLSYSASERMSQAESRSTMQRCSSPSFLNLLSVRHAIRHWHNLTIANCYVMHAAASTPFGTGSPYSSRRKHRS